MSRKNSLKDILRNADEQSIKRISEHSLLSEAKKRELLSRIEQKVSAANDDTEFADSVYGVDKIRPTGMLRAVLASAACVMAVIFAGGVFVLNRQTIVPRENVSSSSTAYETTLTTTQPVTEAPTHELSGEGTQYDIYQLCLDNSDRLGRLSLTCVLENNYYNESGSQTENAFYSIDSERDIFYTESDYQRWAYSKTNLPTHSSFYSSGNTELMTHSYGGQNYGDVHYTSTPSFRRGSGINNETYKFIVTRQLAQDLLDDFENWDIAGNTTLLGQQCWLISGYANGPGYTEFSATISKTTGIWLSFEGVDYSGTAVETFSVSEMAVGSSAEPVMTPDQVIASLNDFKITGDLSILFEQFKEK